MKRILFIGLCCLALHAQVVSNPTGQHGVTLTITAQTPAPPANGVTFVTPTGFNLYRSATSGGTFTLIGSGTFTNGTATYSDGCAQPPAAGCTSPFGDGSTWFYIVTGTLPSTTANLAIVNTRTKTPGESVDSAAQAVTFPTPTQAAAPSSITVQSVR